MKVATLASGKETRHTRRGDDKGRRAESLCAHQLKN
jgi:hypothetical protein